MRPASPRPRPRTAHFRPGRRLTARAARLVRQIKTARNFEFDELAREMQAADEARTPPGASSSGAARRGRDERDGEAEEAQAAAAAALQVELAVLAERLKVAQSAHAASEEDGRDEQAALLQRARDETGAGGRSSAARSQVEGMLLGMALRRPTRRSGAPRRSRPRRHAPTMRVCCVLVVCFDTCGTCTDERPVADL